jgi:hypothetical protein
MRIFELKIDEDDDLSGIQYISIVKSPANEFAFEVFSDETPHTCYVPQDFSDETLKVLDNYGEVLNPDSLVGARIKPAEFSLTKHGFAPQVNPNPRNPAFGDQDQPGGAITRYIYGVDTGLGAPLIRTSREMCRKMIAAQKVFSITDINNLSSELTSASDTFKLVPRAKMNAQVDAFQYKMGALCRHRWFQIDFPIAENSTYEETLKKIPLKAQGALGSGINIGGAGRPFIAEAKVVPPSQLNRRPAGFSKDEEFALDPVNFHFGLFMYPSRFAALVAEPSAKKITKVKVEMCDMGWGCEGYIPIEIYPEYFEGTAKVEDVFSVRHNFIEVPKYIQDAAQRAVDYAEENGWGDCGTDVGKQRAHDLARAGAEHSLETLTRMYSYGSRHKVDWDSSKSIDDGCGYLMMLSWGFSPDNYDDAMNFLKGQIDRATQMNIQFSRDEFRQDITAVVFQPNQYIYRYDRQSNSPYWVFMSKETIRTALMKLSRLRPKNLINFEHSDKVFSGDEVYSYENWLVGEDPKMDKSYEIFGREFEPGTWITTIHFRSKELFEDFILSNKTSGISLEGLFEEIPFNFFSDKKQEFVYPNAGESESDFIGRCMGDSKMVGEFPDEQQRLAVCYNYYSEKMNYEHSEDKEMVDGIVELLLKVRDLENRKQMAKDVIRDFARDGIHYDYDDFIRRIEIMDFGFNFPEGTCWEGYEPYGTKILDGREVPNCVPVRTSKQTMEDYPWDKCIADMTERYGSESAPRICGKIRSENMGLQGINGKVPFFDLEEEANLIAQEIGCEGSHKMEYGFVPCRTHAQAEELWDAHTRVFLLEELIKRVMG